MDSQQRSITFISEKELEMIEIEMGIDTKEGEEHVS